jgi:hypothetical protein
MQKIISLTVDFQKAVKYTPEKIVKGDYSGVVMEFDIVQDITDHTVRVAFETADGTNYLLDCVNVDGKAVLELPSGVLSVIGVVNCQIAVYDLDSRLTNPMGFYFFVVDDLSDGAISASDDVPILMDLIAQVNDIINTFEGATWEIFNEGVI